MDVESSEIIGGSSGGAGGSGIGGDDIGLSRSPPRDSARGKGVVVETEETTEVPIERVEFQPAVGSSGQHPISKNFVEFVDDAMLARLLQDNPAVVAVVVAAREERRKAIALA